MILKTNFLWIKLVTLTSLLNLLGCVVETKSNNSSPNKDVSVSTPVGTVKAQSTGDVDQIGVKLYPGATLKPDTDSDHNNSNANLSVSSPLFGMKLVVQKYQTPDSPEAVISFYQKELSKFGQVIRCNHGEANAASHDRGRDPDKDAPVSCDDKGSRSTDDYKIELKVGTERNQHIVAVKPEGKGSAFALVYVNVQAAEKGRI